MLETKDQGHNADGISKKVFASKFRKFSENFKRSSEKKMSSKVFSQAFLRSSRRNKIDHDLGPFSTSQNLVLSSSREQGIFEDLGLEAKAKDFKLCS